MTFLSLGWLIYINLWHSSTHIRDQHHAESATDHHGGITARKVKCCGDNNSPRKTLPHHIEELARIYIYIYVLYYLYIYIYTYVYCIYYVYDIYRGYLEPKEASLSVESKSPVETHRATTLRTWSKRPSRCGPSGALRISKRGKAVNSYVKSLEDMYII